MIIPVIICGGSGSRLWPVSREQHPKPFITLADGQSLLQKTYNRACSINADHIVTVTNESLLFLTKDEYLKNKTSTATHHYLLEPCGRNTAPAIAIAAAYINKKFGADATMLVLSADHLILNSVGFMDAVNNATTLAQDNRLVTFGIQPNKPETGYGYIESNGNQVIRFVEKPNFEDASKYVLSGKFLWNAGIFCFKASFFLAELEKHQPALYTNIYNCLDDQKKSSMTSECAFNIESFSKLEDISIDYAIMEKSDAVSVVPCDIGWSDVGSWDSISALTKTDAHGNQIEAHVVMENTHNCFIKSEDTDRLISTVGLDNLIIVDTPDALLISDRNQVQDVKKIVSQLKKLNNDTYKIHRTVARPWGTYTVLETGDGFKIKRIVVKPSGSLSLQMHHHRSEHWIVVSGVAKVVNGDQEILIHPNQSTYIPAGQTHRLTNPGVLDCVMIEVQVGSYLGEDDIVRFTDIYGRC